MTTDNIRFQITFCQSNLRWLRGNALSDDRDKGIQFMEQEIERLTKLFSPHKEIM